MKILEELELRQVNTLNLPADKRKWPVTVTVQELDALLAVAHAAKAMQESAAAHLANDLEICWSDLHASERALNKALQELRNLGNPAAEMAALQQELGLHD